MKKLLFFLLLIGVALVVGAAYYSSSGSAVPENGYSFKAPERGDIQETVSISGPLQPREVAMVGSAIPGKVIKIYPGSEPDQTVKEGQELLELDLGVVRPKLKLKEALAAQKTAQSAVKRAQHAKKSAEKAVEIQQDLLGKGPYTKELEKAKSDLDTAIEAVETAEANLERANAAVEEAQEVVNQTTLRAPISGVIIEKEVVLGQSISPLSQTLLFLIAADMDKMQIRAQIAQSDLAKLRQGLAKLRLGELKTTVTVDGSSIEDEQYPGRVVEIRPKPTMISNNAFYTVVIEVDNPKDKAAGQWRFLPGMMASVNIVVREHKNVWQVPEAAVSFTLDEHFQTQAAKDKLAQWRNRKDFADLATLWILDRNRKPWPVFVRIGGKNRAGETGIQDDQYKEVLEWPDPELPVPDPEAKEKPQFIIGAPPTTKKGFLDQPVKLF